MTDQAIEQSVETDVDTGLEGVTEANDDTTVADDGGDESGSESTETGTDEGEESVVYEIDGEEINLNQIREWKQGHQRQSDYTKKTQAVAAERKALESRKTALDSQLASVTALITEVEKAFLGDASGINWAELRQTDTSEYLRMKEVVEGREKLLSDLKSQQQKAQSELAVQEAQKLAEVLGWSDEAKRADDIKQIETYTKAKGITPQEFAAVNNHKVMAAFLDAAKYQALQAKKPAVMKQVKASPKIVTKPQKQAATPAPKSMADVFYGSK